MNNNPQRNGQQPLPPRRVQNVPPSQPQPPRGANTVRPAQAPVRPQQPSAARQNTGTPHQNAAASKSGKRPVQQPQRSAPKKVPLTEEQKRMNRIKREKEKALAKKKRAASLRLFGARFALFMLILILLAAIGTGLFFMNLTRVESTDSSRYSYTIGDDRYSLQYSKAVHNGRVYVSFTDVAEMCDLSVIGSTEDMKYVIKGDEAETIRFITDSRVVYVNDVETRLGVESFYEKGELYVPVDFVRAYFKGLNITVDEKKHEVEITRVITNLNEKGKLPKGEDPIYADLSFLLQSAAGLKPLDAEEEEKADIPDLGFLTNLVIYEEYMNPGNTEEFLTLVNVNNKLDSTYTPQDIYLVEATRNDGRKKQELRMYAAMALEALFKEMKAAGYEDVSVTSAYRSYSYQEQLFNQYLAQHNNDYEYVSTFSNPPGSSEHQTGLCVDMHNLPSADVSFANEEVFKWLEANCWKFGFILRYPSNKVDITGISFEPWHYRYVGRYHAQRMYQMNMCLEEYLEYIHGDS